MIFPLSQREVEKHNCVSFDIFDTIISRSTIHPTDVFERAGMQVLRDKKKAALFRYCRMYAERKAVKDSANGEVTLDDIYRYLPDYDPLVAEQLKQEEMRQEIELCRPRESVDRFLSKLHDEGKPVYLISDMYLNSDQIRQLLDKCGITGFDRLYVSNECGCSKKNGGLFRYVRDQEGIGESECVHMGDDIRADRVSAPKAGFLPCFVIRKHMLLRFIKGRYIAYRYSAYERRRSQNA